MSEQSSPPQAETLEALAANWRQRANRSWAAWQEKGTLKRDVPIYQTESVMLNACAGELEAALAARPPVREGEKAVGQWQPIEAAPRVDELTVLVWDGSDRSIATYYEWAFSPEWSKHLRAGTPNPFKGWCDSYRGEPLDPQPTHWMPLPAPPELAGEVAAPSAPPREGTK